MFFVPRCIRFAILVAASTVVTAFSAVLDLAPAIRRTRQVRGAHARPIRRVLAPLRQGADGRRVGSPPRPVDALPLFRRPVAAEKRLSEANGQDIVVGQVEALGRPSGPVVTQVEGPNGQAEKTVACPARPFQAETVVVVRLPPLVVGDGAVVPQAETLPDRTGPVLVAAPDADVETPEPRRQETLETAPSASSEVVGPIVDGLLAGRRQTSAGAMVVVLANAIPVPLVGLRLDVPPRVGARLVAVTPLDEARPQVGEVETVAVPPVLLGPAAGVVIRQATVGQSPSQRAQVEGHVVEVGREAVTDLRPRLPPPSASAGPALPRKTGARRVLVATSRRKTRLARTVRPFVPVLPVIGLAERGQVAATAVAGLVVGRHIRPFADRPDVVGRKVAIQVLVAVEVDVDPRVVPIRAGGTSVPRRVTAVGDEARCGVLVAVVRVAVVATDGPRLAVADAA